LRPAEQVFRLPAAPFLGLGQQPGGDRRHLPLMPVIEKQGQQQADAQAGGEGQQQFDFQGIHGRFPSSLQGDLAWWSRQRRPGGGCCRCRLPALT